MTAPPEDNSVPLETAARLLKWTPRSVQNLVSDGFVQRNGRGRFPLVGLIHGYIDYRDDRERKNQAKTAQNSVAEARREEIELRTLERRGELIETARAEGLAVVEDVLGGLRAALTAAPARITADLELRRKIETVLNDALREAANRAQAAAAGAEDGGETADAGGPDDAGRLGGSEQGLSGKHGKARAA
jgi:hypothetical protein